MHQQHNQSVEKFQNTYKIPTIGNISFMHMLVAAEDTKLSF